MAGPDGQIVIPDPNSTASQFASKVREIFDKQSGIAGQGADIPKKAYGGKKTEDAQKVFGDVEKIKNDQNVKNVPGI